MLIETNRNEVDRNEKSSLQLYAARSRALRREWSSLYAFFTQRKRGRATHTHATFAKTLLALAWLRDFRQERKQTSALKYIARQGARFCSILAELHCHFQMDNASRSFEFRDWCSVERETSGFFVASVWLCLTFVVTTYSSVSATKHDTILRSLQPFSMQANVTIISLFVDSNERNSH